MDARRRTSWRRRADARTALALCRAPRPRGPSDRSGWDDGAAPWPSGAAAAPTGVLSGSGELGEPLFDPLDQLGRAQEGCPVGLGTGEHFLGGSPGLEPGVEI